VLGETSSVIESAWTEIPGGAVHYRVSVAPPERLPIVLLIHGLVVASTYMVPTAERIAPFCRVYAPDLPGYGESYKPEKDPELIRARGCAGPMDGRFGAHESAPGREFIRLPNHC